MANWKIERELFSGKYEKGKNYSHIANELEEVKDYDTSTYRIRKSITYSLFLTLILNEKLNLLQFHL